MLSSDKQHVKEREQLKYIIFLHQLCVKLFPAESYC